MDVFVITQYHQDVNTREDVTPPKVVLVTDDEPLAKEVARYRSDAEDQRRTYRQAEKYSLNRMLN